VTNMVLEIVAGPTLPAMAVSDGARCCREVRQALGHGRTRHPGGRGDSAATPHHEARPPSERARSPDHGAPDHPKGEVPCRTDTHDLPGVRAAAGAVICTGSCRAPSRLRRLPFLLPPPERRPSLHFPMRRLSSHSTHRPSLASQLRGI
jgi:hypothetical protein